MSRRAAAPETCHTDNVAQRIDKWLWCARIVKTRTLAAALAGKGRVRLTRGGMVLRVQKMHMEVRPGDRLSFVRAGRVRTLEVLGCAERRGPASEAQKLYAELL